MWDMTRHKNKQFTIEEKEIIKWLNELGHSIFVHHKDEYSDEGLTNYHEPKK